VIDATVMISVPDSVSSCLSSAARWLAIDQTKAAISPLSSIRLGPGRHQAAMPAAISSTTGPGGTDPGRVDPGKASPVPAAPAANRRFTSKGGPCRETRT
jgi:hypothetical protein